jgi:hypothetical protein
VTWALVGDVFGRALRDDPRWISMFQACLLAAGQAARRQQHAAQHERRRDHGQDEHVEVDRDGAAEDECPRVAASRALSAS